MRLASLSLIAVAAAVSISTIPSAALAQGFARSTSQHPQQHPAMRTANSAQFRTTSVANQAPAGAIHNHRQTFPQFAGAGGTSYYGGGHMGVVHEGASSGCASGNCGSGNCGSASCGSGGCNSGCGDSCGQACGCGSKCKGCKCRKSCSSCQSCQSCKCKAPKCKSCDPCGSCCSTGCCKVQKGIFDKLFSRKSKCGSSCNSCNSCCDTGCCNTGCSHGDSSPAISHSHGYPVMQGAPVDVAPPRQEEALPAPPLVPRDEEVDPFRDDPEMKKAPMGARNAPGLFRTTRPATSMRSAATRTPAPAQATASPSRPAAPVRSGVVMPASYLLP